LRHKKAAALAYQDEISGTSRITAALVAFQHLHGQMLLKLQDANQPVKPAASACSLEYIAPEPAPFHLSSTPRRICILIPGGVT
jgi:hypothetical protein